MTQASIVRHEQIAPREIIAFPRVDEFYNMLQYRLNMTVSDFTLQHKFTIIINALPRKKTEFIDRYAKVDLIYAGIEQQRILLEGKPGQQQTKLDDAWNFLDAAHLDSDTAVVSSQLYRSFAMGSYQLADIPQVGMGTLKSYFRSILEPGKADREPTPRQLAEYEILNYHFDVDKDRFVSLPLVMFGEIDGILHFVYSDSDSRNIKTRSLGNLIRVCSAMFETQILEWDLVGRNPEKTKAILQPLDPSFYENVNRNPILRELGFQRYYQKYLDFYKARIRFNDDVIHSKVYRPYLKTAIISIMIDSYAHNVSAHSLVALNWWFKQRAENLRSRIAEHRGDVRELKGIIDDFIPEGFDQDRVYDLLKPWIRGLFVKNADPQYDLVNFPGPLAREVQPLLKFLMQKGAFWSGIARDNHFGGESASLFDVLWYDFVNNPLYLGTIAKSEDIHRVTLRIVLYEPFSYAGVDEEKPCHRPKKILVDGEFMVIDLKKQRPEIVPDEKGRWYLPQGEDKRFYLDEYPEFDDMSDFVSPGADYDQVKQVLLESLLFFPGEVVGRHAFFTLIENEIRNVKHYKGADLRHIQENGLELCISLQDAPVKMDWKGDKALCRIGIWINTPTPLRLNDDTLLLQRKYNAIKQGVMDEETFAPHLGGGFQDKICAGMLFNNRFSAVQNGDDNEMRDHYEDTARDHLFYPWITPASSAQEHPHADIEFTHIAYQRWEDFYDCYEHDTGYLKKYFNLWKAADIRPIDSLENADFVWDNLARFRFVSLAGPAAQRAPLFDRVRRQGVIRIIESDTFTQQETGPEPLVNAYRHWLRQWIGREPLRLQLRVDKAVVGEFHYDPATEATIQFVPEWALAKKTGSSDRSVPTLALDLAHGGDSMDAQVLRYRNHGVYKSYFLAPLQPGQPLSVRAQARMAEFFEILTTRIAIFDSRIHHRIKNQNRRQIFEERLFMHIRDESSGTDQAANWLAVWEKEKEALLTQTHFLVLHLSFIEKILLTKYSDHPDYADENIGLFIEREILPHLQQNGTLRDNFMLVITTGRGRTKWWSRLMDEPAYTSFQRFTMFRPVESIISAVEDAINRKDDLELKYNLVKVMFGS